MGFFKSKSTTESLISYDYESNWNVQCEAQDEEDEEKQGSPDLVAFYSQSGIEDLQFAEYYRTHTHAQRFETDPVSGETIDHFYEARNQ